MKKKIFSLLVGLLIASSVFGEVRYIDRSIARSVNSDIVFSFEADELDEAADAFGLSLEDFRVIETGYSSISGPAIVGVYFSSGICGMNVSIGNFIYTFVCDTSSKTQEERDY